MRKTDLIQRANELPTNHQQSIAAVAKQAQLEWYEEQAILAQSLQAHPYYCPGEFE